MKVFRIEYERKENYCSFSENKRLLVFQQKETQINYNFIASQVVFLPECFDYVGESRELSVSMAAKLDSPRIQGSCELAKELGVWLSLGGYHEKVCIIFIYQQFYVRGKVISVT